MVENSCKLSHSRSACGIGAGVKIVLLLMTALFFRVEAQTQLPCFSSRALARKKLATISQVKLTSAVCFSTERKNLSPFTKGFRVG